MVNHLKVPKKIQKCGTDRKLGVSQILNTKFKTLHNVGVFPIVYSL